MAPSATLTTTTAASTNGTVSIAYQNPAIPGFAPDPSVIQVEGIFYLVTSSFHVYPGIPIYVSEDLQTWVHIGNAINRPEQLDLSQATTHAFDLDTGFKMVASGGLWAPTIRHHKGRFYIICTNCCEGGEAHFAYKNFYIWTDDIYTNEWSDPIFLDFKGIDPSLFFDDDDRVYFQGAWELTREQQPTCTIKQMEIDIATGKPLTELREIWGGHAQYDTEGPHIYKKDGYYYLLVAEGGTFENHLLSISRSRSIWGPYESYANNPIMTARGTKEYIQNIGHGEFFQDIDGSWWAAVLGIRDESGGRCPIGRETFLTPVHWPEGGWPTVTQPRTYFRRQGQMRSLAPAGLQKLRAMEQKNRAGDVYIRNADLRDYRFEKSSIYLRPRLTDLSSPKGITTFVGKRQRHLNFVADSHLHIDPCLTGKDVQSGMVVYKDDQRHIGLYYDYRDNCIFYQETMKHLNRHVKRRTHLDARPSTVHFRIQGSVETYKLFCYISDASPDGISQIVDTERMTARDFTGTIIGLVATSTDEQGSVRFDNFELSAIQSSPKYISNMLSNARSPPLIGYESAQSYLRAHS